MAKLFNNEIAPRDNQPVCLAVSPNVIAIKCQRGRHIIGDSRREQQSMAIQKELTFLWIWLNFLIDIVLEAKLLVAIPGGALFLM